MGKEAARRKREKAIKTLRECGMSDAEIETELGYSLESSPDASEIIDVEIVSEEPCIAEPLKSGGEEAETRALPLPARLGFDANPSGTQRFPQWSEEWWSNASPEVQARRCVAHSTRTGLRCKKAAIAGATLCRYHGGASKFVKEAARRRLDNAADRMARNLLGLATEADSEPVRLGATNSALDRVGITKPTEVVLSQGRPYEEVFDEIATNSRESSRAARGYVEDGSNTSGYAAGYASDVDAHRSPAGADRSAAPPALADFESGDPAPASATQAAEPNARDAQQRDEAPRRRYQHARSASPGHVTGDNALRVAAQFTREQLALESPHKRYKRPQ